MRGGPSGAAVASAGREPCGSKGKGRGKQRPARRPDVAGKGAHTMSADTIRYAFNLATCVNASPGGRCPRGMRVCAEPEC